jgi:ankyrin repeat protein
MDFNNGFNLPKQPKQPKQPKIALDPLEQASVYMRKNEEENALFLLKKHSQLILSWENKYGNSIANIAAWNGCVSVLKYLSSLSFNFDLITLSVMGARHLNVLEWLHENQLLVVNAQGNHGTTPLQQACNIADSLGFKFDEELVPSCLERIRYLIAVGADIEQLNSNKRTALMSAAHIGAYPVVDLLLSCGANCSPSVRCDKGKSTIDYAFGEHTENLIRKALIRVH